MTETTHGMTHCASPDQWQAEAVRIVGGWSA